MMPFYKFHAEALAQLKSVPQTACPSILLFIIPGRKVKNCKTTTQAYPLGRTTNHLSLLRNPYRLVSFY